jgi:glycopeptide antibiotics resistance protein
MKNSSKEEQGQGPAPDWSNRVLILAIAGILFLTLFPFGFEFHTRLPRNASPFLLQSGMKGVGVFDDFLNVLLFIPFGFGIAERLRQRGRSRGATLILTLVAGAMLSYGIEFLQNYIPSRDAGWHDVLTNTTGSLFGFALFELAGKMALRVFSVAEGALGNLLTLRRAAWVVPLYFMLWFAASVHLQKETQPRNWDPNSPLVVGNSAAGRPASGWKGEVDRVEFWSRAVPDDVARGLTVGETTNADSSGSLAAYEFSGAAPFRDERNFLPDLSWKSNAPPALNSKTIVLDGKSWFTSGVPVSELVKNIQGTNQFSVHVDCTPGEVEGADTRIVSISRASGLIDLDLRQENANLVFWFRNPISASHALLAWYIPNVFVPRQKRDILFSYDGANLFLYINGLKEGRKYELGPGTSLARLIRRVKPSELVVYKYVYYALLFFTGGILLGITCRKLDMKRITTYLPLGAALLLPPIFLEIILVHVSGRARSLGDIVLGFCLAVGGSLWINADRSKIVETNGCMAG